MQRLLRAWLTHADPRTTLLPDRIPGGPGGLAADDTRRLYTPHNSGADLYPYLVLTAHLTDPGLYRGRMLEMLRNEIRYTTVQHSIPANLELSTGKLGPPSLFGAGEYAKDGLLAVTEYLGRTPWTARMVDLIIDAMRGAPIASRFGPIPASDSELNGDYLQVLVRLETMTGRSAVRRMGAPNRRCLRGGGPAGQSRRSKHAVGLRHAHAGTAASACAITATRSSSGWRCSSLSRWRGRLRARRPGVRPSSGCSIACWRRRTPDGMLYNEIDAATLAPRATAPLRQLGLRLRRRVHLLPGHRRHALSGRRACACCARCPAIAATCGSRARSAADLPLGSFDGYADTIESAIYLVNREPVPEAARLDRLGDRP